MDRPDTFYPCPTYLGDCCLNEEEAVCVVERDAILNMCGVGRCCTFPPCALLQLPTSLTANYIIMVIEEA